MTTTGFLHRYPDGTSTVVKFKSGGWIHWFTGKSIVAATIRRTIYIKKGHGVSDVPVPHELVHVDQWHTMGTIKFIFVYLFYLIKYGYNKHPLEQEAREKSGEPLR